MTIRSWNGSSWVRPKFWTGSQWKVETDPTTIPLGSWNFTSTTEGWIRNTYSNCTDPVVSGGTIYSDNTTSGLLAGINYGHVGVSINNKLPVGTAYRGRYRLYYSLLSGSLPSTISLKFSLGSGATETISRSAGSSGWFEYMTGIYYTTSTYQTLYMSIELSNGSLDGNSIYRLGLDWATITDASGNALMVQDQVEYRPRWWDGSTWRL